LQLFGLFPNSDLQIFAQKPQFGFFSAQKMCFLDLKLLKNRNSNLLFAIFPCVLQTILAVFPAKIAAFPQSPRSGKPPRRVSRAAGA